MRKSALRWRWMRTPRQANWKGPSGNWPAGSSPRDTFVLYAAAHGYSVGGNYYMIPQDYQGGPNPAALKARAIGQERLQDWIANRIKAKKALILLDTCESGALTGGYTKSRTEGPVSEAAVGRLHEATGRPVLTAASGGKSAYEGYKGHGVFTYALMEALHQSDTNNNGKIEVSELAAHVEKRVPELFAELKAHGWVVKGVAAAAARGSGGDTQSAHFGSIIHGLNGGSHDPAQIEAWLFARHLEAVLAFGSDDRHPKNPGARERLEVVEVDRSQLRHGLTLKFIIDVEVRMVVRLFCFVGRGRCAFWSFLLMLALDGNLGFFDLASGFGGHFEDSKRLSKLGLPCLECRLLLRRAWFMFEPDNVCAWHIEVHRNLAIFDRDIKRAVAMLMRAELAALLGQGGKRQNDHCSGNYQGFLHNRVLVVSPMAGSKSRTNQVYGTVDGEGVNARVCPCTFLAGWITNAHRQVRVSRTPNGYRRDR